MLIKRKVIGSLEELKLNGIQRALEQQLKDGDDRGFLERLYDLLVEEKAERGNRKIKTLMRQAKLRWPHANAEDISYVGRVALTPEKINNLSELVWVDQKQHVVLTGATGCGKTYIACALAVKAIMRLIPPMFMRYKDLLIQLQAAENEGRIVALHRKLNRIPVLIIDDLGVAPLNSQQRHLLFEFIESRDKTASLIITSQYAVEDWHDAFGDQTIADSVLDRIVHNAHIVDASGPSMREALGVKGGGK